MLMLTGPRVHATIETDVVTRVDDAAQGALQGAIERYAWFLNRPVRC
jgi:hypothetical protein